MAQMSAENLEQSKQAENPQEMLHSMRKSIDAIIQWTEQNLNYDCLFLDEMDVVRTKLIEAKMWTGKCLEAIGSELPEEYRDKAK